MSAIDAAGSPRNQGVRRWNASVRAGAAVLLALALVALAAPLLPADPNALSLTDRLKPPSGVHWFGTDAFGRDVFTRVVWGTRVSLLVGLLVAGVTVLLGLLIGGVCGFVSIVDAVVMRVLDGVMAIPGVLLAIAIIAVTGPSVITIVAALAVPEIPSMARLVRSVILSVRQRPWVEAAVTCGCPPARLIRIHLLPSAIPIVLVQAAYVTSAAILGEAILSFLGVGTPPDVPSWGSIVAQGKSQIQIAPWVIAFPSLALTATVLAVNLLGDGLRDAADPRRAPDD